MGSTRRRLRALAVCSVSLAACAGSADDAAPAAPAASAATVAPANGPAATAPEDYPDAITRHLDRLASAPRPVEPSAIPPRHLDTGTFPTALVDRTRIVSGGPPPDGIPPIDEPRHEAAGDVDWLEPNEPVLALLVDDVARAYPLQVLIWHEVVNDELAGTPVAVTYCPLCDSGVVYHRRVGDDVLDFGTSGALYQANLVLYDRQTESLWTQFDGRAVVGTRVGVQLDVVPSTTLSWADFRRDHPDGTVLARDEINPRPYGRNPYNAYDRRDAPLPGFFTGDPDATLAPFARVVGVETDGAPVAVPTLSLADVGVAEARFGDRTLTFWHQPGTSSAVNAQDVADGADIGSTAVFVAEVDGSPASFTRVDDRFVDDVTGSAWNLLGEAIDGPLAGARLDPVPHVDTFWFAWATFHVGGALFDPAAG